MEQPAAAPPLASEEHLKGMGISFSIAEFPGTTEKGTNNISKALGAPLHLILKTLIFQGASGKVYLCLVGGDQKLDTAKLCKVCAERNVGMALPGTVLEATGYRIGAIPPFGLRTALPVFIDSSLAGEGRLLVGSGRWGRDIVISGEDLGRATRATFAEIAVAD